MGVPPGAISWIDLLEIGGGPPRMNTEGRREDSKPPYEALGSSFLTRIFA
jgi:hypothetical protein